MIFGIKAGISDWYKAFIFGSIVLIHGFMYSHYVFDLKCSISDIIPNMP